MSAHDRILRKLSPRQQEAFHKGTPQEQAKAVQWLKLKSNIEKTQHKLTNNY